MTIPAADCPHPAMAPDAAAATTPVTHHPTAHRRGSIGSFIGRHPVASFLVAAYVIFWASWAPVLFLGAPPRLFSALGAALGLALPAFLITAATDGKTGVDDLMRRALRWRVGLGWYVLAGLAIPSGGLLLASIFLGPAPLHALGQNWPLLFTAFLPQLLLALATVQSFEELGWSGFVQHRLQARHGALKASLLVALAFAFLHLPTYLRAPISGQSAVRDLSVLAIVIPFAIVFRILIAYAYNRTACAVSIAAITHASFNEASELIAPNVQGALAQMLAFASTTLFALFVAVISKGTLAHYRERQEADRLAPIPGGGPEASDGNSAPTVVAHDDQGSLNRKEPS